MKHFYTRVIFFITIFFAASPTLLNAQVDESLKSELDSKLDMMLDELDVKGLAATLISPNEESWNGASGISSETPLVAISNDMAFGIASITKTLTASVGASVCRTLLT